MNDNNGESFNRTEWENTSSIIALLEKTKESHYLAKNTVNKMLNDFVLFLLREDIFRITPEHGIDEYGIPNDYDFADEMCFAPLDGEISIFRYQSIVPEIKNCLKGKNEDFLKTLEAMLGFRKKIKAPS